MFALLRDLLGITALTEKVDTMAKQDTVDALVGTVDEVKATLSTVGAQLGTAIDGVQADLDALMAREPDADITALQTSVSGLGDVAAVLQSAADRLTAVDAENPVLPPAEPTDPEPVDPTV